MNSTNHIKMNHGRLLIHVIPVFFIGSALIARAQETYPFEIQMSGPVGTYDVAQWKKDWKGCRFENGVKEGRSTRLQSAKLNWLRVLCPANQVGPEKSGIAWNKPIPPSDRVELAYLVKFSEDFDFSKGGVLPGLSGGHVGNLTVANPQPGFSARIRWREEGRGEVIIMYPKQDNNKDQEILMADDFRFPRNQPFMMIMRIGLNEIGESDGTLEVWVKLGNADPNKVINRTDFRWRSSEEAKINSLNCEVYFDGQDPSTAPMKNCWVDLAEFKLFE